MIGEIDLHKGFYDELAELQREVPDANFGFLKNEDVSSEFNAYEFLHGYCGDFAGMLSDVFGYEIECLRETDECGYPGKLIHAYCVSKIDGQKVYVDIRGITTDSIEFFEEFKNHVTYFKDSNSFIFEDDEGYEREAVLEVWEGKDKAFEDLEGWTDEDIQKFILQYRDYYDTSRLIKRSKVMSTYNNSNIYQSRLKEIMDTITIDDLREMGFKGYQMNALTGCVKEVNYPLANVVWTMRHYPESLCFQNHDIKGTVSIMIEEGLFTPEKEHHFAYIERPMTVEELLAAKARLENTGFVVTSSPSLTEQINSAATKTAKPVISEKDKEKGTDVRSSVFLHGNSIEER